MLSVSGEMVSNTYCRVPGMIYKLLSSVEMRNVAMVKCAMVCTERENCVMFNYHEETGICQVSDSLNASNERVTSTDGWTTFAVAQCAFAGNVKHFC